MEQSTYKQSLFSLTLAVALGAAVSMTPAMARGTAPVGVSHGSTDKLSSFGVIYNGAAP